MSIFGSKKRSLDDIIKDIQTLSDEDRAKLTAALTPDESAEPDAPATEDPHTADSDNASENEAETAETAEETSSEPDTDEDPAEDDTPAEDPAEDPAEGEEEHEPNENPAQASVDYEALISAMQARIEEMSGLVAELTERCNSLTERLDGGSFGNHAPGMPTGDIDEEGEMTPTMRSYMSKQPYRGSAK